MIDAVAGYAPPALDRPYAVMTLSASAGLAELDGDVALNVLKAHGALLIQGGAPDVAGFRAFTERLCSGSVFNESPDRLVLDEGGNIQSVNGGADPFPLHPELSREPWKPDVCFFHCLTPPAQGGETTICDGVEIVRRLPPALATEMARHRLMYPMGAPPEILRFWLGTDRPSDAQLAAPPPACPYRFVRDPDGIWRYFTRPLLHRPLFTDAPAFGNFLLFARDYLGRPDFPVLADGRAVPETWLQAVRDAAAPITAAVPWQTGDLLILDNSRFMHGRRAIDEPRNRLIATFFGYLRDVARAPEEPEQPIWRRSDFRPPSRARG